MLCRDEEHMLLLDTVENLSHHGRVALLCGLGCGVEGPFNLLLFCFWLKDFYLLFY